MKKFLLSCFATVVVLAPALAQADVKAQMKKLQGSWKVVRVEADGRPLPAEKTEGWTLTGYPERNRLNHAVFWPLFRYLNSGWGVSLLGFSRRTSM